MGVAYNLQKKTAFFRTNPEIAPSWYGSWAILNVKMKSKLLFLPDIFLVVLICLSCERTDLEINRETDIYKPTSIHQNGGVENHLYKVDIKDQLIDQFEWKDMVGSAKTKLDKLKSKSLNKLSW